VTLQDAPSYGQLVTVALIFVAIVAFAVTFGIVLALAHLADRRDREDT
jgi:hypothetical protein